MLISAKTMKSVAVHGYVLHDEAEMVAKNMKTLKIYVKDLHIVFFCLKIQKAAFMIDCIIDCYR